MVGGIAAELNGDKFKNGEISVAFNRMFNDLAQVHKVMNTPKNTYNGWTAPTGVIFAGVGGALALVPHPFAKGIGYSMMSIGGTMEIYDMKMSVDQVFEPNSSVIKLRNNMNEHYGKQEKSLEDIGF
ncbi:hypothetical protein [Bathymodiolus thermophilus thioautotrophic gill symbiont]|uniref:Uncharacterized protein n=1 Tax=Bathymodiolus thermophilus thioautotrophic gill symbiont TaxID=2360 RepID=A0A1J5TVJ6_9GAMM|nr:hypothetical protein [Bathymodiolus thermophilus thioautotrophic gill symbiont]OIR24851.1 hypothetical protein BGC33_04695 [Bathymodiolus thermophilus thioautotrophic gill symbiont]